MPRVHSGFLDAYQSVRKSVLCALVGVLAEHYQQRKLAIDKKKIIQMQKARVQSQYGPSSGGGGSTSLNQQQQHVSEEGVESPPLQVYFTGHSLGGALAVLAALDFALNMEQILLAIADENEKDKGKGSNLVNSNEGTNVQVKKKLKTPSYQLAALARSGHLTRIEIFVYTMGSPRIGNVKFASIVRQKIKNNYRIELDGDVVTCLPPPYLLYQHVGDQVCIDAEEAGSCIVKPSIVESQLLSKRTASIQNHRLYRYRACLEKCFEPWEIKEYRKKEYSALKSSTSSSLSSTTEVPDWLL